MTGEEKVWVYPNDEDYRIDHWFLPDANEPSKAIVDFEQLQRDAPTLALLSCLPRERRALKMLLDWWFKDAGDDERKGFVYLYNEQGNSCSSAMDSAYDIVWTGVKGYDYKGLGECIANNIGLWERFDDPEEAKKHFDFEGFAKSCCDPKYDFSRTFDEWCVVTYEIIYYGDY